MAEKGITKQTEKRMDGLVISSELDKFTKAAAVMARDFENEGFDEFDIFWYLREKLADAVEK